MRSAARVRWIRVSAAVSIALLSAVAGLGIAETGLRMFWDSKLPQDYVATVYNQLPPVGLKKHGDCRYRESMAPHPYFGFVYGESPGCIQGDNAGFSGGRDIPLSRDPAFFTILVLGGSFAEQFSHFSYLGPEGFEQFLNRNYVSPSGKPFRILNAAMGGWKAPQSVTALDLYGESVDAAISIDGFLDATELDGRYSITMPPPIDYLFSQRALADLPLYGTLWITRNFLATASAHPFLRRSTLVKVVAQALVSRMVHGMADDGPGRKNHERLFKFFALPGNWPESRRRAWNLSEYEKSIRLLKAEADTLGVRYVHFLQPIPALKKPMTDAEKQVSAVSAESYLDLVRLSEKLKAEGMPVTDLTDVFAHETGTIYADSSHPKCSGVEDGCRGYALVSERIARELAARWHLRRLPDPRLATAATNAEGRRPSLR